jgi:hypothetical protein
MKKKLIGILIVLFLVISYSGAGYAEDPEYVIGFRYVQHRTLENGKTINLVAVGMNSNYTNNITDYNVIEGLKLYRLDGENQYPMELIDVVIQDGKHELFPRFNSLNRQWEGWDWGWHTSSYYIATIVENLIPNTTYRIEVECDDGNYYIDTVYFRDIKDMRVVSSKSFKYKFDEEGNFYWHWQIPKDMFYIGPEFHDDYYTRPSVRAMIEFYNNGTLTDEVWIKIPYLMGGVFVPAASGVFDVEADRIEIGVQVRIQDNTYRSYSNYKEIKKMP